MYWYLSFLRPPPVALAIPADGVVITPQVANDLRTELRDEPTPISYVWQRLSPTQSPPTQPVELTVFEPPASTYRSLTVPLPKGARPGERWRLGLLSPPSLLEAPLLALSGDDVPVMGVWSEGIELKRGEAPAGGPVRGIGAESTRTSKRSKADDKVLSKGKGKKTQGKDEAKQTRITRAWPLPGDSGALRLVEQTSFDLDKKVWDSGLALASWLWRYLPREGASTHTHELARRVLGRLRGGRSLELGSGTGLVSIALGQLDPDASITATDLESAMEIMEENVRLSPAGNVAAAVLDWDAPLPAWVGGADGVLPPVIVAADVTYNTASFPALVRTLEALLKPPPRPPTDHAQEPPLLLLAYKQRDAAERDLWDLLAGRGIGTTLVDQVRGAEDDGVVEIWVAGVGV